MTRQEKLYKERITAKFNLAMKDPEFKNWKGNIMVVQDKSNYSGVMTFMNKHKSTIKGCATLTSSFKFNLGDRINMNILIRYLLQTKSKTALI